MVEFAFNRAQALVGQHARVPPAHQLVALGVDGDAADGDRGLVAGSGGRLGGVRQQIEPVLIPLEPCRQLLAHTVDHPRVHIHVVLLIQRVEPVQRGLHGGGASPVAQPQFVGGIRAQA